MSRFSQSHCNRKFEKNRSVLLVLDTLILFQMELKSQQENVFKQISFKNLLGVHQELPRRLTHSVLACATVL